MQTSQIAIMRSFPILFGGNKGGTGKDLCTAAAFVEALRQGLSPTLVEVESDRRLGLIYPETRSILVDAPSPEAIYANPDQIFDPIDQAAKIWKESSLSITSLGANLTSAVLAWGRAHGAERMNFGADMTFAIVMTMNNAALAASLQNLFEIGLVFPAARRVAILNDIHADFLEGDQFLARRLEEARGDGSAIDTIRIRRCAAPAWGYAQNMGSLQQIAEIDPKKLIDLGLPEGPVYRSKAIINSWISDGLIAPLSALLPQAGKPKKSRSAK